MSPIRVSFSVRCTTKENINLLLAEQYLEYIIMGIEQRIELFKNVFT